MDVSCSMTHYYNAKKEEIEKTTVNRQNLGKCRCFYQFFVGL